MSANSDVEDESKIKKEQPSTPSEQQQQQQQQSTPVRLHQRSVSAQLPQPSNLNNGNLHTRDLLQGVFKGSKFNNFGHLTPAAKHEAIRIMLEDSISDESRCQTQEISSRIEQMKVEEKLLLYLKLSVSLTNPNGTVDPLRQPLNPLGNRYEIHQTIMWIKTHLEEDPDVSLPKQEVYDEYNIFCAKISMKPLSTADFGKVMKQVYPRVRPRRLGTRGNSRYCYSGMRKRIKLDPPTLPSTSDLDVSDDDFKNNVGEDMLGAASTIIREWAESVLEVKFPSLCSLGKYLVNNLCVDNRSLSAVCILSASEKSLSVENKVTSQELPVSGKSYASKLREAQLQLQRKLQSRENVRDKKDLQVDDKEKNHNNENVEVVGVRKIKRGKTTNSNHPDQGTTNNVSSKGNNNNSLALSLSNAMKTSTTTTGGRQKKILNKSNNQSCSGSTVLQSNCDNLVSVQSLQQEANEKINVPLTRLVRSNSAQSPREIKPRQARKRAGSSAASATMTSSSLSSSSSSSLEKQLKLTDILVDSATPPMLSSTPIHNNTNNNNNNNRSTKTSVILASSMYAANKGNKTSFSNNSSSSDVEHFPSVNQSTKSCDKNTFLCTNKNSKLNDRKLNKSLSKNQIQLLSEGSHNASHAFKNKLGSIDSDTLNDYLNGGNNSQEQEEELLQYFHPSNSSSSDMELSNNGNISEIDTPSRQDQVSQLRMILQENLQQESIIGDKKNKPIDKQKILLQKQSLILPILLNNNGNFTNNINTTTTTPNNNNIGNVVVNAKRRVSFETSTVDCSQDSGNGTSSSCSNNNNNTIPQSPNTRRRIFNFTPISPGPLSPINNGAAAVVAAAASGTGRLSKSSSANASPFVSPRNTPVPRSRSNLQGYNCRALTTTITTRSAQKTLSRSISCNVPCSSLNNKNDTFIVPINTTELIGGINKLINNKASQSSTISPPPPPPLSAVEFTNNKTLPCTPLLSDLGPQEDQLLINYPSQENLQEIKSSFFNNSNNKPQPTDQEITDLLQSKRQQQQLEYVKNQFYRSQSVPLHRMVDPVLLSPISSLTHQTMTPTFHHQHHHSFNASADSSIAPTPVPSEFNDFSSIGGCDGNSSSSYLLDPLVSASNHENFLIEDKNIMPDNLNNLLDFYDQTEPEMILSNNEEQQIIHDKDRDPLNASSLLLGTLDNASLSDDMNLLGDNSNLLDSWTTHNDENGLNNTTTTTTTTTTNSNSNNSNNNGSTLVSPKLINSLSYSNNSLSLSNNSSSPASTIVAASIRYSEDSNGSVTPQLQLNHQQDNSSYTNESNEPMLFNPNSLGISSHHHHHSHNRHHHHHSVSGIDPGNCYSEFLERSSNNESVDLGSLVNFDDGLQDVDTFSPLFNEVVEPNH